MAGWRPTASPRATVSPSSPTATAPSTSSSPTSRWETAATTAATPWRHTASTAGRTRGTWPTASWSCRYGRARVRCRTAPFTPPPAKMRRPLRWPRGPASWASSACPSSSCSSTSRGRRSPTGAPTSSCAWRAARRASRTPSLRPYPPPRRGPGCQRAAHPTACPPRAAGVSSLSPARRSHRPGLAAASSLRWTPFPTPRAARRLRGAGHGQPAPCTEGSLSLPGLCHLVSMEHQHLWTRACQHAHLGLTFSVTDQCRSIPSLCLHPARHMEPEEELPSVQRWADLGDLDRAGTVSRRRSDAPRSCERSQGQLSYCAGLGAVPAAAWASAVPNKGATGPKASLPAAPGPGEPQRAPGPRGGGCFRSAVSSFLRLVSALRALTPSFSYCICFCPRGARDPPRFGHSQTVRGCPRPPR